jgi:fatty acid desaturase
VLLTANLLAFAVCWALLGMTSNPWLTALIAVALGIVSGQLGFQLHDSAHQQMFANRRLNGLIAFITGNCMLGMSAGWWTGKHNAHHGNPNHVDLDPDIDIGVIAYSSEQAAGKSGVSRFIAAYQAYLFFPLLFGLAWIMHVKGVQTLFSTSMRHRTAELVALGLHAVAYMALLVVLVGPWRALLVIVIHKCVGGFYLASVFAPNHKGMPQVERGESLDFLRAQVLTARNVRSHPLTDLLYGSLNYQIEHHLFPTMPRCNLRRAQAVIADFCAEVAVPYYETSIVQSYREILSFLHEVGAPLRAAA